jgi:hypothetical protein
MPVIDIVRAFPLMEIVNYTKSGSALRVITSRWSFRRSLTAITVELEARVLY